MMLSPGFIFLLLPLGLVSLMGENSLLALLAVTVLGFGLALLWRPGVSPILMFVFSYQWLQVSLKIFQANFKGVPVDTLSQFGGPISGTIVLGLLGLLIFGFGMRLGAGPPATKYAVVLQQDIATKPGLYWFKLYMAALLIATVAQVGAKAIPGLSQPFLAVASLKWAFYWAFTYATFSRKGSPRNLWFWVFALELVLGLGSYFSDFKTILFFTMLALAPVGLRMTPSRVVGLVCLAVLTLAMGVVWSSIKSEYRSFLSQGERAQIVVVETGESLRQLLNMATAVDGPALMRGVNALVERVSYIDIFARTLDNVPAYAPHQNGAVWGDAILRPFTPRIFFPGKLAINDSEFTNQFSGLGFATSTEGASISIGYMGEAYIDFGYFFMMAPIFLLGLALGWIYKWISNYQACRGAIGMGLATVVLYPAAHFETSITKLIGGLVVSLLIAWLFARWGARFMRKAET